MNGTEEAPAGAPLAAHFEAKRRIMATVKQMEDRGEKLEEATPEEILEAASKAAETVFKFGFSISEGAVGVETSSKKRNQHRKRNKKRRARQPKDDAEKSEDSATTERLAVPVTPAQQGNAKDASNKQKKQEKATTKGTTGNKRTGSTFLKLRKATGTESEVAKMHLRYGQGRRNLAATKQRDQRKKDKAEEGSSDFRFNFSTS